jgi:hypothetical protein
MYTHRIGISQSVSQRAGGPGFDSRKGQALEPTQPSVQWVPGAVSLGVRRQECVADHSPLSSVEVKNGGAIPPLLSTSSWRGA